MSHDTRHSGPERRDQSQEGRAKRVRFEASLKLLADLGLSPETLEYYRLLARKKRTLPHIWSVRWLRSWRHPRVSSSEGWV